MTFFLLMRHAQPDFSGPRKWDAPGWGGDLAPLTEVGERQVNQQVDKIREFNPELVITSPATRALHSAMVLRPELDVPFKVEFDLHEWVPDRAFRWRTLGEVQKLQSDFERFRGEWPPGETKPWETIANMRLRALGVFRRYLNFDRVLAVCHGQLIKAITGVDEVDLAELVPLEFKEH